MPSESMWRHGIAGGSVSSSQGQRNPFHSLRSISRDCGTNAWFQELPQEAEEEGDAAFSRLRAPLFWHSAHPHVFSAEERWRMDKYESIDYNEAHSLSYKARMLNRKKEHRWLKWMMFIAVGVCVGLWSVLLLQTLDLMSTQKLMLLERYIVHVDKSASNNEKDFFGRTPGGVRWSDVGRGYLIYLLWSGVAALLSSLCCVIVPSAAGSGVPDVMAYLNGIMFPRIFNIRTLVVK
ncbi:hypothetical protein TRSC58_04982, partial [Trypanosoma rangeli SC58]